MLIPHRPSLTIEFFMYRRISALFASVTGCLLGLVCLAAPSGHAAELDYNTVSEGLRVEKLDSADTESFLGVKADSTGRLFVGSRVALYVYEPREDGGYEPRQELLRLPEHTWVYDIEIRGDDVYLLTVSALYVVPNARVQRKGLSAHRLVWGVPLGHVHQCFHGMTWGPDGDLYFSMGDPLWYYGDFSRPDHWGHWTMFSRAPGSDLKETPKDEAWVKTPYTGVGAVFRCRPDGSGLQVVARGLRNSCGLVFDKDWNLFTNDNDHESMPAEYVPGRLNHVTPHAYFNWPRGWMREKTPDRADLLETMITTLGRAVPVGQWYYNDGFLPELKNSLLVARWCTRKVTFYPLSHHGSTFHCTEHDLLAGRDQARPVGVTVGRGGRVFATICYMAQNEGSPVYKSDLVMITRADDKATHPFMSYDAPKASTERLLAELSQADWSRRYLAHVELQRRSTDKSINFMALFDSLKSDDPARVHLPYLMAAFGALAQPALLALLKDANPMVRLQAVRVLSDGMAEQAAADLLATFGPLLKDENAQVRQAAVLAFFGLKSGEPVPAEVLNTAAVSEDTYLRQAATLLLAEKGTWDEIGNRCQMGDAKNRLAGVLAAGFKLTLPPTGSPIAAGLPLVAWRAEDAYKIQFVDSPENRPADLRTVQKQIGLFTVAEHWKAGKHTPEQEKLFALLVGRLGDESEPVRLQAAYFLSLLNDSTIEPAVAQVRRDTATKRLSTSSPIAISKTWVVGPFADGGKGFDAIHAPERGPLDPAASYKLENSELTWKEVTFGRQIHFREMYGPCDNTSSYAALRMESGTRQTAMLLVGSDDGVKVWHNGRLVWTNDIERGGLPIQDVVVLDLQPGSNDLLVRVRNRTGEHGLYLHYRALQPLAVSLPEKIEAGSLAARLKEAATTPGAMALDPKFLETNWAAAVKLGNIENGKKLFGANGLGCAKCHAVKPEEGMNAGPSLAEPGKRFTLPYLVESVLLPSKQISPVFKATTVETKQGKVLTGLVVGETGEKLEMILTDATRITIPTAEIEERKLQSVSPMPNGLVKTPEELRDILAYLLSGQ